VVVVISPHTEETCIQTYIWK